MRISAVETRRYRFPLDPPFNAAWDPAPRTPGGDAGPRAHRGGRRPATAAATRCPTGSCWSACWLGSIRCAARWCASSARRSTSTAAGRGRARWRPGMPPRAVSGVPLWRLLGGRNERLVAYASSGERVDPEERARRCLELRDAGVRAVKLRFGAADWRDDVAVVRGVREAVGDGMDDHGRRQPGLANARRPVAALGRAAGAAVARALEPLGVHWLEEPLPTWTSPATRRCARRRRFGSPPARWCGALTRRATCSCWAGSTSSRPMSSWRAGSPAAAAWPRWRS